MNSNSQVVLVHAVKNKRGQVGFFVESADKNSPQQGENSDSNNEGKNNHDIIEDAKKYFSEYERAVESATERLKKNPVLQMYYNNPPSVQYGCNHHARNANRMLFCSNPQNQVWYRFSTQGGRAFCGNQSCTSQSPQRYVETKISHSDLGVQASMKEPLAYNLTFIPTPKKKKKKLPEIRVLVPTSDDEIQKHRKKKRTPVEDDEDKAKQEKDKSPSRASRESSDRKKVEPEKKKKGDRRKTLQEYLKANRPEFIERAEKRRQCLADLAILRDLRKQKYFELSELTRKQDEARERATTRSRSDSRAMTRIIRRIGSSSSSSSSSY